MNLKTQTMAHFEETKRLLEDSTFYYIITTNMEGRYTYANNCYNKAFHPIHGPIVGQRYEVTMHPDDVGICGEVAAKCFEQPGSTFPATIRKHDGKGGFVITQWEYSAILNEDGSPEGVFCLGHDITDYMAHQVALEDTRSLLGRKSEIVREITFYQSHIIRRPLANLIGLALVLDRMELDQNLRNICDMVIESSRQLDDVIRQAADRAYD